MGGQGVRFLRLSFTRPGRLHTRLSKRGNACGGFSCVVRYTNIAGYSSGGAFSCIGCLRAGCFVSALGTLGVIPGRFVCVDALDMFNPMHRGSCAPVRTSSAPTPGATCKFDGLGTRLCVRDVPNFPCIVCHPAKICKPHRASCFLVTGSVRGRISFSINFQHRSLAFICIGSVIRTVFLKVRGGIAHEACFLASKGICGDHTFSSLVRGRLNGPFILRLGYPLVILGIVSLLTRFVTAHSKGDDALGSSGCGVVGRHG